MDRPLQRIRAWMTHTAPNLLGHMGALGIVRSVVPTKRRLDRDAYFVLPVDCAGAPLTPRRRTVRAGHREAEPVGAM